MTRRETFVLCVLLLCILLLYMTQIALVHHLDDLDVTYAGLQTQLKEAQKEHDLLEEQVLHASALTTIAKEAKQQGFTQQPPLYLK